MQIEASAQARGSVARAAETARAVNAVRRIMRLLRLAAGATQSALGMSAAQLYVLEHLDSGAGQSIRDLAARTMTDRSSVAAVVDRLVERGLAERARSRDDRRRADVRLTRAGRELLQSAPPAPTTLLRSALERMEPAELRGLSASLERLVAALGIEASPADMMFDDGTGSE